MCKEDVAYKMKSDIINSNNIKSKLIKSGLWTADNISRHLQDDPDITEVTYSPNRDKLYLTVKDSYLTSKDTLDVGSYKRISSLASRLVSENYVEINKNLDRKEMLYITETGVDKMVNTFYNISPVKSSHMLILDI